MAQRRTTPPAETQNGSNPAGMFNLMGYMDSGSVTLQSFGLGPRQSQGIVYGFSIGLLAWASTPLFVMIPFFIPLIGLGVVFPAYGAVLGGVIGTALDYNWL